MFARRRQAAQAAGLSGAPSGCPERVAPFANRRAFLRGASLGFGWLAFTDLVTRTIESAHANDPSTSGNPANFKTHFAPRAKRIIFLFMDGGVSHIDTFDPKPELTRLSGQPAKWRPDPRSLSVSAGRKWLGSPWQFKRYGQSGMWVSDLFPYQAKVIDELCVIRSLTGETPLHGAQSLLLHTGRSVAASPSMGSWVSYGLGSENQQLPGYVLLNNDWIPNGGFQNFASSYLPAIHQATMVRAKGTPVDNIVPSDDPQLQQAKLAFLGDLDSQFANQQAGVSEIESAIRNYETAARMQILVPELCDVSGETAETLSLYGVDRSDSYDQHYALQCLRARRLVESGVRFVEITCPNTHGNNSPWDQHGELKLRHAENARITDQPVAALIIDLKRRGLLDETLVGWAGEMGRTPHSSGNDGRDHHVSGYTIWMAGGGVRGGMSYGATDELGMSAVEDKLDIHDIHATMLHLMGIDHERLTFRFGGREMRLTDVHGRAVKEILS
ncbi:MAG TPA: DUF1501 domain-containing protein [Planctomycetaceae bacterium]|nr:DUF1501 domain-containing protein [Planctomycetaceae bacterium]